MKIIIFLVRTKLGYLRSRDTGQNLNKIFFNFLISYQTSTARKMSIYGVFSGPHWVQTQENTDQKKFPVWTLFRQCPHNKNSQNSYTSNNTDMKLWPLSTHSNGTNLSTISPTKWSNTLKQFVGKLPANFLSLLDHFVDWCLKG